ncbi:hypothetical protein AWZ03_014329 [Drosophila navojoa]|nr:hypothetical protein AWZ03_014329 [Drosophila navojoa]
MRSVLPDKPSRFSVNNQNSCICCTEFNELHNSYKNNYNNTTATEAEARSTVREGRKFFVLFFCIDSIDMSHTILLVQPGARPETRTYCDYESVNECMEGVCKIYEEHLKRRNPNTPTITYDISQLFDFIDTLIDISCLVYQKSTNTYAPYNKDWIKEKIYVLLRQAAFSPNA